MKATDEELIAAYYRGILGREPDSDGLKYWVSELQKGKDLGEIASSFMMSPEYLEKKYSGNPSEQMIDDVFSFVQGCEGTEITIVDVGAQTLDYEDHVYSALQRLSSSKVIGFEPLEGRLLEREEIDKDKQTVMLPVFIGDGNKHTFHINKPDATSSLLPFNQTIIQELLALDDLQTVSTEEVSTVTLDRAIADIDRVDFLKLDIQGFEHAALACARAVLSRTLVVHCEVSFVEIYEGQKLFSEVDQLLRAAGFRFVSFNTLCEYSFVNGEPFKTRDQLGWGDAVYFKEIDKLSRPEDLLIQSLIALVVYKKASLSTLLAREYDFRTGKSCADLFKRMEK